MSSLYTGTKFFAGFSEGIINTLKHTQNKFLDQTKICLLSPLTIHIRRALNIQPAFLQFLHKKRLKIKNKNNKKMYTNYTYVVRLLPHHTYSLPPSLRVQASRYRRHFSLFPYPRRRRHPRRYRRRQSANQCGKFAVKFIFPRKRFVVYFSLAPFPVPRCFCAPVRRGTPRP